MEASNPTKDEQGKEYGYDFNDYKDVVVNHMFKEKQMTVPRIIEACTRSIRQQWRIVESKSAHSSPGHPSETHQEYSVLTPGQEIDW